MNETTAHPCTHPEYLGCIAIMRQGEPVPSTIHVIQQADGTPRYCDDRSNKIIPRPADRKTATVVMEDDDDARQEALRAALQFDRWQFVTTRG